MGKKAIGETGAHSISTMRLWKLWCQSETSSIICRGLCSGRPCWPVAIYFFKGFEIGGTQLFFLEHSLDTTNALQSLCVTCITPFLIQTIYVKSIPPFHTSHLFYLSAKV